MVVASLGGIGAATAQSATTPSSITLVSSSPADSAVLTAAPPEILLNFAAALPDMDATVQLQNSSKQMLSVGQPIAFNNRMSLRIRVLEQNGLPAGTYSVIWVIKPHSGTAVSAKFSFTLQAPGATGGASGAVGSSGATSAGSATVDTKGLGLATSSGSSGGGLLGVLGRLLGYIGIAGLAGGLALIVVAWSEGVEYVLTVRHLVTAWAIGTIGDLFSVASAASAGGAGSVARGMVPTSWGHAMHSTFGKFLVLRLVAMAACVWVARKPERLLDANSQWSAMAGPAVVLVTYGWSRHAAGTLAAPIGIAHVTAVAVWFGGAALLVRVVLAGPGEADLVGAVRGFRRLANPALVVTVITGLIEMGIHLGGLGKLAHTTYGRVLVIKILAVAVMAVVATANRQYARQRFARARHLDARPAAKLQRSVRTEVSVGLVVFLLTAAMVGSSSPKSTSASPAVIAANRTTFSSNDGTFSAQLLFGPRRTSAKVELHFTLLKPSSIRNGVITLTPPDPSADSSIVIPIAGTPRYGFGPAQGFQFPVAGTWKINITGKGPNGDLTPIEGTFTVTNADGSVPTTTAPPTTAPPVVVTAGAVGSTTTPTVAN